MNFRRRGKDRRGGECRGEREPGKPRSSSPESQAPPAPAAAVMVIQTSQGKKKCHLQIQLSHPEKLSCSGRAEQRACESGVHRGGLGEAGQPLCASAPQGAGAGNC